MLQQQHSLGGQTPATATAGSDASAACPDSEGLIWAPCKESEFQYTDSLFYPPLTMAHVNMTLDMCHMKAKLAAFPASPSQDGGSNVKHMPILGVFLVFFVCF